MIIDELFSIIIIYHILQYIKMIKYNTNVLLFFDLCYYIILKYLKATSKRPRLNVFPVKQLWRIVLDPLYKI